MASENLKYRIAAYRGERPYAFVSYAHDDADVVFAEFEALSAAGLRFYYDEGIHPGHTWHQELAKAIEQCAVFVLFVTARSVASRNCQRELAFALDNDKPVVAVHLEDTELPAGVRLAIGDRQAIIRSRFDEARYRERLLGAIREHVGEPLPAEAPRSVPQPNVPDDPTPPPAKRSRIPLAAAAIALVAVVAAYVGYSQWRDAETRRAAIAAAIADAEQLVQRDQYGAAFNKVHALVAHDGDRTDARLLALWQQIVLPVKPRVAENGATMSFKPYDDTDGEWIAAGTTPFAEPIELPKGVLRVRLEKPGFETGEFAVANPGPVFETPDPDPFLKSLPGTDIALALAQTGALPPDMVPVPALHFPVLLSGWTHGISGDVRNVPAFAVSRYEVTNREFKEFVGAGGYDNPAYWEGLEFRDGERTLAWTEARARFVDRTGRAAPAEWELATYPDGKAEFPVTGVSWYEAVAYARFRHLSLPTLHHWVRFALAPLENGFIVGPNVAAASRFLADGPVEAHTQLGLGPWGTYNTAGNVREWIWNAYGDERIALGGSWRDYFSTYQLLQAAQPMQRLPELGFRLMKSLEAVPDDLLTPIPRSIDAAYAKREPVSDEAFGAMRFQFTTAERTPRDVKIERFAESDTWTGDEVLLTYAPNDTFALYVFLPKAKRVTALQPILYAPPGDAFSYPRPNREVLDQLRFADIVPNGGRALVIPIWSGTYQRVPPPPASAAAAFDRLRIAALNWYDDAAKTIGYLATRNDMDIDRIGMLGISAGAFLVEPILLAVDGRLKAGVLIGTGIPLDPVHPMADAVNYAPRIHVPVLMINGRYDSVFPYELSQVRLFELLGSPAADKKHVVYDAGHFTYPRNSMAKDATDWFDTYLGPVK